MRTECRVFGAVCVLMLAATGIYAGWTRSREGAVEPAGAIALGLSALLSLMLASYFYLVARRIRPRPEDQRDGEVAQAAGVVGFFSPGSYWPFAIGLSAAIAMIGLVFEWWVTLAGLLAMLASSAALVVENVSGARRAGGGL